MKRVAVEAGLSPVRDYLSQRGFQVEEYLAESLQNQGNYAAIVISGQDQNLMGMQDQVENCPVISASGLTPEEVCRRIEQIAGS